jgi:hypothetical protein
MQKEGQKIRQNGYNGHNGDDQRKFLVLSFFTHSPDTGDENEPEEDVRDEINGRRTFDERPEQKKQYDGEEKIGKSILQNYGESTFD